MDPLDLGILRELSRDQIIWFGRLDPRLSAAEIARRLRVDRATVGSRLHAWERQGFLLGHEVVPSPLVFGARVAGGNLRIDDLLHKPRVLSEFSLVPGLISAVDHVGPWVALLYAFESNAGLERSRRLAARLAGVAEVSPCVPFHATAPTVAPAPTDWRILDDLRREPRRPFGEIARSVHLSAKTLARRLERLVRGRAVWYLPLLDFGAYSKATVVRFIITLRPGSDPGAASHEVARRTPGLAYVVDATKVVDSEAPVPPMLDVGAHLDSIGQAEDVQRELSSLDRVGEVELLFPRRVHLYREWFDERIELALARADPKRRPADPSQRPPAGGPKAGP